MKAGDTFALRSRMVDGGHPRIVLCDPHDGKCVTVNITEWNANKDQSCILDAREDAIVTKKSIVSYRDAAIVTDAKLQEYADSGEIIITQSVSTNTLEKILCGCGVTRFIKQGPYDFLDQLGLIPVV